jgi:TfoX/Sxy family transcriptional regulator of competence genes
LVLTGLQELVFQLVKACAAASTRQPIRSLWSAGFRLVPGDQAIRFKIPPAPLKVPPLPLSFRQQRRKDGSLSRSDEPGRTEQKMFGGLAVLVGGHMAVGVYGDGLLVHTDPGEQATLLAEPGTRLFDMSGRRMKGWILVDASVCSEDDDLRPWVARGVAHARSLPPK